MWNLHGLSAYQISSIIKNKKIDKTLHIFDSFEGLSQIDDIDSSNKINLDQKKLLQKEFSYDLDLVKNNLKEFKSIKYYKGWIPERFSEVKNIKFSFVHIDVDLYQPIKDSFNFFYKRLSKGGIMVFDDYGYTNQFPGAKKAVDELVKFYNPSFLLSCLVDKHF